MANINSFHLNENYDFLCSKKRIFLDILWHYQSLTIVQQSQLPQIISFHREFNQIRQFLFIITSRHLVSLCLYKPPLPPSFTPSHGSGGLLDLWLGNNSEVKGFNVYVLGTLANTMMPCGVELIHKSMHVFEVLSMYRNFARKLMMNGAQRMKSNPIEDIESPEIVWRVGGQLLQMEKCNRYVINSLNSSAKEKRGANCRFVEP